MRNPGRIHIYLSLAALLLLLPPAVVAQEPVELQQARQRFQTEVDFTLRPIRDRYVARLETLKRTLASKGDLRAAVEVQNEIDLVQAIANETAIRAKLVGTWTGQFKDGVRRFTFKADGTVEWGYQGAANSANGRLLRDGKDFVINYEHHDETQRLSLADTGGMVMDIFTPRTTYPAGPPAYRVSLARSASSK